MRTAGVPWRRVALGFGVAALVAAAVVVAVRSDGFQAIDATAPRATRWFVDRAAGRVVLADGFAGRTLVRLDVADPDEPISVVQAAGGVALIDRSAATVQPIDAAALQLGSVQSLPVIAERDTVVGIGQPGLVAVDPAAEEAWLVPPDGEQRSFRLGGPAGVGSLTRVAPDGSVWTIGGGEFARITTQGRERYAEGIVSGRFTLVGNVGMVIDTAAGRVRYGRGNWVDLPDDVDPSEARLQEPGPTAGCGWVGFDDRLWCVSERGVQQTAEVPGLSIGGGDRLAIAGDAAVRVDQARGRIERFDWRSGEILTAGAADVPPGADLEVWSTIDLVWVDDRAGDIVWAIHPWGINAIVKDDPASPRVGDGGAVVDTGRPGDAGGPPAEGDADPAERLPDNNGVNDPPRAVDDSVTARSGGTVQIQVTANDWDPDGDAVAVWSATDGANGTVTIAGASSVVYQPAPGFLGTDRFQYTITDPTGLTDTAEVTVTLLAVDAPNSAPIGARDFADTAQDVAVDVDVLLNDVDPERDPVRLGSWEPTSNIGGTVTESVGPHGLPALRFDPPPGRYGTATFTYRPMDALGAVGEPVPVTVEIAQAGASNRPPEVNPDAVRLRRNVETHVAVLANDRDLDGDPLSISLRSETLPAGIDARVDGDELVITAGGGAADLSELFYEVSDGIARPVPGQVLVVVEGDSVPNRPPVANADTATAVAGEAVAIDVLANDSDPDGDQIVLIDVSVVSDRGVASGGTASARVHGGQVVYASGPLAADDDAVTDQLRYTIADIHGETATGTVSVRLLPERIEAPPFAQDDSVTTFVDQPVRIDVLRNDSDPSGEKPQLLDRPSCPGGGTVEVGADSHVTFTPEPGVAKVYRCKYVVRNSIGLTAEATITISVIPRPVDNQPPRVGPLDAVTVRAGETRSFNLLDRATDPDHDVSELRVVSVNGPRLGTARPTGNLLVYTAPDRAGFDSFEFVIGDPEGAVGTGRQAIVVTEAPEPQPPVAIADARSAHAPVLSYDIDVLANDSDDGPTLRLLNTVRVLSGRGNVTVAEDRYVRFTPVAGVYGPIVAEYTIEDSDGLRASATVTLTILPPLNQPPVASDGGFSVDYGGSRETHLGDLVSDPDGDPLTFRIVSGPDPSIGSATLTTSGVLRFTARDGASGSTVLRYEVADDEGAAVQADFRIAVQACAATQPVAPNRTFATGYMQPIDIDLTQLASGGTVVDVGPPLNQPVGRYTPPAGFNDTVEFTYAVVNACGARAIGTVTIDVNRAPEARSIDVSMGRTETRQIAVGDVASDPDGQGLRFSELIGAPGWAGISGDGQYLNLVPAGATGPLAFRARVADPGGLWADVTVTVTLANTAPTTPAVVEISVPYRGTAKRTVAATDPDGDTLRVTVDPPPAGSGYVITVNQLEVTVDVSASSAAGTTLDVPYQVNDGAGGSAAGVLRISVGTPPPTTTTLPPTTTTTTLPPTTTTTVPPTTSTTVPPTTTTTTTTVPATTTPSVSVPCVEYPPPWPNPSDPGGAWPPGGVPFPPRGGGSWCP